MNRSAVQQHNRSIARQLSSIGFKALPCRPDKTPLTPRGFHDASNDPGVVEAWWRTYPDAIPGIIPGTCDLVVIDLDIDKASGDPIGERQWEELCELHRFDAREMIRVPTPSGGTHCYVARPSNMPQIGNAGPASRIDIRCDAGYVIAPGSMLPDGRSYGSQGSMEQVRLAALTGALPKPPSALLRGGQPHSTSDAASLPMIELDQPAMVARAVAYLKGEAPAALEGQHGDATTLSVAMHLRDIGIGQNTALNLMAEHWNERCSPPWDMEGLAIKVRNAFAYARGRAGEKSPEAAFATVVLPPIEQGDAATLSRPTPKKRRTGKHGDDWSHGTIWRVRSILPAQGSAALIGPPGAGKSFLGFHLAHCLAVGTQFFGAQVNGKTGTIIIACEAAGTMNRRLAGLPRSDEGALPIRWLEAAGLRLPGAFEALVADIEVLAAEIEREHHVRVGLVILDTLRASGIVANENDNSEMAAAVGMIERLAARFSALGLIIHHPTKTGPIEAGGGALRAGVDALLMIEREGKAPARNLRLDKSRDAEERELGSFVLRSVLLGDDAEGIPVTTCVVEPSTMSVRSASKERRPKDYELFIECLDGAILGTDGVTSVGECRAVEVDAVLDYFRERRPGSRDRSNIRKAFYACMAHGVAARAVHELAQNGLRYLAKSTVEGMLGVAGIAPLPSEYLPTPIGDLKLVSPSEVLDGSAVEVGGVL